MRLATTIARWVVRLAGIVLILLGITFWTGHALALVPLHMALGALLVLALFTLAVLALVAGARRPLAGVALVWGVIVLALGMAQTHLVPGPAHWTIRVLHLLVGLAAMALAERLAEAMLGSRGGRRAAGASERAA